MDVIETTVILFIAVLRTFFIIWGSIFGLAYNFILVYLLNFCVSLKY